jgi:hypothetical protein
MKNQDEYIKQLEQTINKFLEPLKGIPFPVAIKALTGFEVLAFDKLTEQNKRLLDQLSKAAQIGGKDAFDEGIITARPNEAGNRIEPFIIEALKQVDLAVSRPLSKTGKKKPPVTQISR